MHFRNEQEQLVAEQAVLAYREVNEAADHAEFGHGMEAIEDAVLHGIRDMGRIWIETAMNERAKKGGPAIVRPADEGPTSSGSRSGI